MTMHDERVSGEASEVVARVETRGPADQAAPSSAELPQAVPPPPGEVQPPEEADAEGEEAPLYEVATSRSRQVGKAGGEGDGAAAVGTKTEPADPATAKEEKAAHASWKLIEAGDAARSAGDCFRASNEYQRALDDGDDAVRARAYVGLGLCAAADGNTARADSFYEQARALDPEVGGYLDTQLPDETRKPKKTMPRKKRNAKRKAAMPSEAAQPQALPGDARNANPYKD
jgi:tetratricopeptide (TPR) repeat protein